MLPPPSRLPRLDAPLPGAMFNIAGSRVCAERFYTLRSTSHPSRTLTKEADALSEEEQEHEREQLEVKAFGSNFLVPIGRMSSAQEDVEDINNDDEGSPGPPPSTQHPQIGAAAAAAGAAPLPRRASRESDSETERPPRRRRRHAHNLDSSANSRAGRVPGASQSPTQHTRSRRRTSGRRDRNRQRPGTIQLARNESQSLSDSGQEEGSSGEIDLDAAIENASDEEREESNMLSSPSMPDPMYS